ncbi:hypothetical protein CEXT_123551 [Caerostris extrusa]|uniref:Uncharacterized protein n=1 Tax=Caerostris extrusa TaxID=172846 RepID=A0AAV4QBU8_CAEEX|nr:hypothetical protein CEXT_123551 [Caerostris extrusa]
MRRACQVYAIIAPNIFLCEGFTQLRSNWDFIAGHEGNQPTETLLIAPTSELSFRGNTMKHPNNKSNQECINMLQSYGVGYYS